MITDSNSGPLAPAPAAGSSAPLPGAAWALLLLFSMNMFNYIDRYVLAAVEPDIRESLLLVEDPEDQNARTKMGLLSSAFLITYMLTAPLFGFLAERYSRWKLIAVGVILWSLASGASGLALTFGMLLLTRCFVGVGEGAYGPVAPAVISDLYPVAIRGRVLSWFYMAIPVGSALGYALGGQGAHWLNWRWPFYLVVVPGLLLGVWAMLMPDPRRGGADALRSPPHRATAKDYAILFRTPSYILNTLGMAAMTFAMGALAWWMPDYLKTYEVPPLWGMRPVTLFGVLTALAGLVGTLAGGLAGDWLRKRIAGSYFVVSGAGMLISVPCALAFLALPFPTAWIFVFLCEFFLFFNTGPTNTILANVTHPSMRATGYAVNILIIHTLGDVPSPPIIGAIADRSSLTYGFVAVTGFMFVGGILWLWAARYLDRDTALAPTRLQ
jgi:MFS transporter, Spinster family, sphingosine-1-phosphate transporter